MGSVTAHDLSFCIGGLARRMLWRCIAIEAITTDVREVLKRPLYRDSTRWVLPMCPSSPYPRPLIRLLVLPVGDFCPEKLGLRENNLSTLKIWTLFTRIMGEPAH